MKTPKIFRAVSALCASAMLMSGASALPASAAASEPTAPRIMGDVNGDCKVTIEDAKHTLDAFVAGQIGLRSAELTEDIAPADVNMDGTLEILDALAIMRYFCKTLVGEQPLWSEIRKMTYVDGREYDPNYPNRLAEVTEDDKSHAPFELRGMYLEIGCAEGAPGEIVEIPVYVAGINQFTTFGYSQFTSSAAKLIGVSAPEFDAEVTADVGGELETQSGISEDERSMWSIAAGDTHVGFGWTSLDNKVMDPHDGIVLATFRYEIPKNAKSGDHYVLSVDTRATSFHLLTVNPEDEEELSLPAYQYTLLDGVIVVK